jgi:hypothetical protein
MPTRESHTQWDEYIRSERQSLRVARCVIVAVSVLLIMGASAYFVYRDVPSPLSGMLPLGLRITPLNALPGIPDEARARIPSTHEVVWITQHKTNRFTSSVIASAQLSHGTIEALDPEVRQALESNLRDELPETGGWYGWKPAQPKGQHPAVMAFAMKSTVSLASVLTTIAGPVGFMAVLVLVPATVFWFAFRPSIAVRRAYHTLSQGLCPRCRYAVNDQTRCPECGLAFPPPAEVAHHINNVA